MTLAETASIMCETIVTEALLRETKEKEDILLILGNSLIGSGQVIVDIYSRFLFEKELFEQREKFELSPAEISDIMERAQKEAYGHSINNAHLNKYAWTWKPHYYSSSSFYNFPYSFGLLFAKGLYSIYQDRGTAFIEDYTNLLSSTGESSAETLAKRFNIDIQDRTFWDGSLSIIHKEIDLYKSL
jgi:oligoendopeptidase F